MEYERAREDYTNSVARFLYSASLGDRNSAAVAAYLAKQHQTNLSHYEQLKRVYLAA